MPQVEICAFSLDDCLAAQSAGAHRVELCGGRLEGGTTPSAGLIMSAREALHIELFVMIRPRGGDFCYSDNEFAVMQQDIQLAKQLGANGVVLGVLQPNGEVDLSRTKALVVLAHPLPVCFHRAFDMTTRPSVALEDIITTGCVRILTSGQQNKAIDGKQLIARLVEQSCGRIEIMAGSGVNAQNTPSLLATGVDALHLSASTHKDSAMQYRKTGVSMAGTASLSEYELAFADTTKIAEVVQIVAG